MFYIHTILSEAEVISSDIHWGLIKAAVFNRVSEEHQQTVSEHIFSSCFVNQREGSNSEI